MTNLTRRLEATLIQKENDLASTVEDLRSAIRENEKLSVRVEELEKQVKNLQKLNELFRRRLTKKNKSRITQLER